MPLIWELLSDEERKTLAHLMSKKTLKRLKNFPSSYHTIRDKAIRREFSSIAEKLKRRHRDWSKRAIKALAKKYLRAEGTILKIVYGKD